VSASRRIDRPVDVKVPSGPELSARLRGLAGIDDRGVGMRGRMRNVAWSVIAVATVAAVAFPGGAAVASGGGGCGRPVSDARGDTVRIRDFCFGPTILRIHPGEEVRFLNADSTPHTVMGANASWGSFRQLNVGKHITYRFTRPGVYPYVCTWHPGMVGAVVVGGGPRMAAGGTTTAAGPVVQVLPQPRIRPAVAAAPAVGAATETAPISTGWVAPWQLIALGAFALLALAFVELERRRRRSTAV
jgi:plastocyanin